MYSGIGTMYSGIGTMGSGDWCSPLFSVSGLTSLLFDYPLRLDLMLSWPGDIHIHNACSSIYTHAIKSEVGVTL